MVTKSFLTDLILDHSKQLDLIGQKAELIAENLGTFTRTTIRHPVKQFATLDVRLDQHIYNVSLEPGGFFCPEVKEDDEAKMEIFFVALAAASGILAKYKADSFAQPAIYSNTMSMLDRESKTKYTVFAKRGIKADLDFQFVVSGDVKDQVLKDMSGMQASKLLDLYRKIPLDLKPPSVDSISYNSKTLAKGILRAFGTHDQHLARFLYDALNIEVPYSMQEWQIQGLEHFRQRL
jgi:hypothetical protein